MKKAVRVTPMLLRYYQGEEKACIVVPASQVGEDRALRALTHWAVSVSVVGAALVAAWNIVSVLP